MELRRKGDTEILRVHHEDGVPFLTFPMLEKSDTVIHGISTRLGGCESCTSVQYESWVRER